MYGIEIKNILKKKALNTRSGKARLRIMVVLGFFLSVSWTLSGYVLAHEPTFGVGPRTIWDNGFGYEMGLEQEVTTEGRHWNLDYHALYGITSNWTVLAEAHQNFGSAQPITERFEKMGIRSKYRFFRRDLIGGVYHAAVIGGLSLPFNDQATGIIGGVTAAYEGRRWMYWGTGRYRINTGQTGAVRTGNLFLYDLALGFRPVLTGYYNPDVVLMIELNGRVVGTSRRDGTLIPGSGGGQLRAALDLWFTYRNWAFKPGIQLPMDNTLSGDDLNYRWVFATEFHL